MLFVITQTAANNYLKSTVGDNTNLTLNRDIIDSIGVGVITNAEIKKQPPLLVFSPTTEQCIIKLTSGPSPEGDLAE